MEKDTNLIKDLLNLYKVDRYQNIFLPKFHTDYPISLDRICIQYIEDSPANLKSNFHAHSYFELHFLLCGGVKYCFQPDENIALEAGSWMLIPCHVTHNIQQYHQNTLLITIQFCLSDQDTPYAHLFKDILHRISPLTDSITDEQIVCLRQMFETSTAPLSLLITQNTALNLVIDLVKKIEKRSEYWNDEQIIQNSDARYRMALEYISNNICHKISAEDVSNNVYLSIRHLNRIFQKKIGKTVSEYIMIKKADKAKEILQISDLPLQNIATELGFSDEYYFNRFFKKIWGISPHKYRLQYRSAYGHIFNSSQHS